MQKVLIIVHVVISVVLIISVLFQQSKQQGLSGSIAGGAETFFGKNKGKTLDSLFNKITTVFAVLFVVSAIVLTIVSVNENKKAEEATQAQQTQQAQIPEEVPVEDQAPAYSFDEEGNLLDAAGTVIAEKAALENEENYDEAGNLIKPGTDEILVTAEDYAAAVVARDAAATNNESIDENGENANDTENSTENNEAAQSVE